MLRINTPLTVTLVSNGILAKRNPKAVFVKKHNLQVNKDVVEAETEQVAKPSAKDWLFLIEGHKKYHTVENLFLDNFVEELDIKTEDPIVSPFTSEVAQAASLEKITAALSVLTMDYLDLIADNDIEKFDAKTLEIMFEQSLNVVAQSFRVSPKGLKKEFLKLKWRNKEKLEQQVVALSVKRKQLINESNSQGKVKVEEILRRSVEPNLFIMSGIEHATIFNQK